MPKKITTEDFIKRAISIHGTKYDYSKVDYISTHIKVCIICPDHGEFWQRPSKHISAKQGCPECAISEQITPLVCFIKTASDVHNNKYDYSKIDYKTTKDKINIICPTHGMFTQRADMHLLGYGCKLCANKNMSLTTDTFIKKCKLIHNGKYDYSKVDYISTHIKVCIICPKHGEFLQTPSNHIQGCECPNCSSYVSSYENVICDLINLPLKQSVRYIIPPYELDIFIPSKNIAIEFNGNYWHSELNGKDKKYHLNKTKLCNEKGVRLIHIFEDEWVCKEKIVKNRLKSILGFNKYKLYARKCIIKEINNKSKSKFLKKYHIQGDDRSSIRLGCFYKNRLVAVMTFGKRRYDKKDGYELIRYCTIAGFTCVGCAGKLLKHFERNWNPTAIISYADLRWSEGNVYNQLGFTHLHNSTPNYFYMSDYRTRYSRVQYQKHKLKDKLETFNNTLSEWENMKNNNFDRIWDCGNMVFEKDIFSH